MLSAERTEDDLTVLVDLFKLSLLFNPLTHIQNPHPLCTQEQHTAGGVRTAGPESPSLLKYSVILIKAT